MVLLVTFSLIAAPAAKPVSQGQSIEWQVTGSSHKSISLAVLGPDGERYESEFSAGKNPSFSLRELANVEDGTYNWELSFTPNVSNSVKAQLAAARAAGDAASVRAIQKKNGLDKAQSVAGHFVVLNGSVVSFEGVEEGANDAAARFGDASSQSASSSPSAARRPNLNPTVMDQVIPDDLIVQSSTCTGFDCVDGESFGFDTFRLKENNLRIHFDDTSTSAGYPANDWRLVANDSASGGANKFVIEDSTAARNPFTIEAGSPANSIYVDSTGNIGLQQSAPGLDVHLTTSDTPAIRLEQTNAGGFTAQTWDVAGNEANFFVRDLTGGSRLSFRIRPGAPTSSLDINGSGDVGVGTASPTEKLHVSTGSTGEDANTFVLIDNLSTGTSAAAIFSARSDTARWDVKAHSSTRTISRYGVTLGGWAELSSLSGNGLIVGTEGNVPVIIGTATTNRIHVAANGNIGISCNNPGSDLVIATTATGCTTPSSSINAGSASFTVASSRTFKENIKPVETSVLDKIEKIDVYQYDFIDGPKDRIGLIAEDFHQVFGRGSEKFIAGDEVQMALWLAVKELTAKNKELTERLSSLEKELEAEK